LFPSNNSFFKAQNKGFKATIFNHHLRHEKDRQTVLDGFGEGAVSRDGEAGHFAQGEMRFYLMDWLQTLLSFFIGVVGGRLLPIGLMFVFIAI